MWEGKCQVRPLSVTFCTVRHTLWEGKCQVRPLYVTLCTVRHILWERKCQVRPLSVTLCTLGTHCKKGSVKLHVGCCLSLCVVLGNKWLLSSYRILYRWIMLEHLKNVQKVLTNPTLCEIPWFDYHEIKARVPAILRLHIMLRICFKTHRLSHFYRKKDRFFPMDKHTFQTNSKHPCCNKKPVRLSPYRPRAILTTVSFFVIARDLGYPRGSIQAFGDALIGPMEIWAEKAWIKDADSITVDEHRWIHVCIKTIELLQL